MDEQRRGYSIVTDLPGDRWLVTLEGEHDLSTAADLRDKLRAVFLSGTALVIDLSATTFVDSSTLAVLVDADRYAQDHVGDQFGIVVRPNSAAERLFALTGVRRVFRIFDSVDDAFAAFEAASSREAAAAAERWQERKQRIVKNEQAFRDYNDRRLQHEPVDATDDREPIPFVCECGDKDCIEALVITAEQFTAAHSAPNRFLVRPGHVYDDVERVVEEHDTFTVVEKQPQTMNA
jgi:anti-sigma B factor antagonist